MYGTQMFGIGSDFEQGLGAGFKQESQQESLVSARSRERACEER